MRRFCRHCSEHGRDFEPRVRIRYRTTIPREVGLAGSSAIVIATLRALAGLAGPPIDPELLPALALSVETDELGIAAGLQDRVVQTYGGLVFMDFARGRTSRSTARCCRRCFSRGRAARRRLGRRPRRRARALRPRRAGGRRGDGHARRLAHEARAALERGDEDGFADALEAGYDVRAASSTWILGIPRSSRPRGTSDCPPPTRAPAAPSSASRAIGRRSPSWRGDWSPRAWRSRAPSHALGTPALRRTRQQVASASRRSAGSCRSAPRQYVALVRALRGAS